MKREVVHIKWLTGSQGGQFWVLTLECGPITTRPKHRPRPSDIALFNAYKRYTAPHHVKCWSCSTGAEPIPVVLPDPEPEV